MATRSDKGRAGRLLTSRTDCKAGRRKAARRPQEIAALISASDMPVMTRSTSSTLVCLRVDVVGDDPAAAHDDDAVDHLEDVVDVVRDEDAGMAGIAGVAHEAQHALRLRDAEIVGRLVEDDEVAVEMHGAGDGHRLALAARQRADRRRRRDVLGDADLLQEIARDRVHRVLVHAVQEARPLDRLAAEKEVARDGELRDQRGILVDRLDAVRDRVGGVLQHDLLAADEDVAAGERHGAGQHLDQRRLAGAVVAEQPDDLAAR